MKHPGIISIEPGINLTQKFEWSSTEGPVQLEGAEIAVRWWKGSMAHFVSTTTNGEVKVVGDGEFVVELSHDDTQKAMECQRYDVFAFLPEHGYVRVTQGPVQIAPSAEQAAIPEGA